MTASDPRGQQAASPSHATVDKAGHGPRISAGWWLLASAGGVLALLGIGIIVAGVIRGEDGRAIIDDPGGALIAFFGLLTVAVSTIGPLLSAVKKQVQNSHTVNLRDDLDGKHDHVIAFMQRLERQLSGIQKDVGRLDNRIDYVRQRLDKTNDTLELARDRLDELEDTVNPLKEK